MLKRKMLRDILQNKSQFITIFLMILIGVMVYVGIESYMDGMTNAADKFYSENNLQDLNIAGAGFTRDDLNKIKSLKHIKNAERKLVLTGLDASDLDRTYLISFIESNDISKFYVVKGEEFDPDKKGVWVDNFYALENNLNVGDKLKIKYDTFIIEEEILGLINVPDHIYDTKDSSQLVPDRSSFGFIYLSYKEIPEEYIRSKFNVSESDSYINYIPYNYVMVDVDSKNNVASVKNDIEDNISSAKAVIKIEDTESYTMYQGEIDEGASYVGIFSGLFLFIALLSVVTTMTRVIKRQKEEIGTLKSLGFKDRKIVLHYVGYGFWISLLAAIFGIILGRYFIGSIFINLEMSFFEVPNGVPIVNFKNYIVSGLVVVAVSLVTYLTCRKSLKLSPAESLRQEMPKVKNGSLNITTKGIFKNLRFSSKWNLRDVIRNKFRTLTGVVGIVGCCTLIVCAFGMLNSMNYFIELQFGKIYNFDYKLTIKSDISADNLNLLEEKYGNSTSQTLGIEIIEDDTRISNTAFVADTKKLIRFQDKNYKNITLDSNDGVYVTYKFASNNGYKIGDTIKWRIYGSQDYYESKIVGFNRDPQNQNLTMTRSYMESLGLKYMPDSLYTNYDLKNIKDIVGVELVQDKDSLKQSIQSMLSMMRSMIILIIFFAIILGAIIIYNMGILSYSEKKYQFATLKVLGFDNSKIKKIFIEQNEWITILSILAGMPSGYFLTSWLFKACLDDNFDFSVHINFTTYIIACIGTFVVSYFVSKFISSKIDKIDMVTSLKGNE